MATTAPINPLEVEITGDDWVNITNGLTRFDTHKIQVQSRSSFPLDVEKESSATPDTSGATLRKDGDVLPLFTKKASYDLYARGRGKIRIEVCE